MSPPPIRARHEWADEATPPASPITLEGEEPRFVVVHHTASGNTYAADAVPEVLRGVYRWHRGKGWPDVAYNFFVDRFGGCWEGRTGSLAGPVRGDATGGNPGYADLVCLVGNFHEVPPAPAAVDALVGLLGWLASRDGIDVSEGAEAAFVSRGSNLWPAGAVVRTRTIAGHREMSRTLCPGDGLFALLADDIPARVRAAVADPG